MEITCKSIIFLQLGNSCALSCSLTMMPRGQKRKLLAEDEAPDGSGPAWESQRQFVLTVSLDKYQCAQQLREPSLRRCVLIANTLRHMSLQVSVEASQPAGIVTAAKCHSAVTVDGCSALASCPAVSLNYSSNSTEKTSYSSESNFHITIEDDEDWGSMSTDTDSSLSAVISSILAALDSTVDGSPQAAPRTPLRPLENLPRPCEGGAALLNHGPRDHGDSREQQEDSSMEVMRSSYLGDFTVEDLFQDIDTSLVDMDMSGIGHRSTEGGHAAGDDLFLYLPPFSPHSLAPSSQAAQPALIGQLA